ncbi:hypothetical protein RRG08_030424 [Elysia crispata]|uniref:Uncharacterized protein n=1 Tax=Elysia crispata TaxID=231223 RepID=A0AAE1CNU9_9GAST|nr:hypothetical protein RRG08_030424 [Elysia crispata]
MNPVTFSFLTGSFLLLAATPPGQTRGTDSIIVNATGSINIDWLTDKNDNTCNNNELPELYLKLVTPVPLKRARVVVSMPELLKDITILYYINQSAERCSGPKTNSGKNMQDISCPTPGNVKLLNVLIGGQAWKGLCSLYLRGDCPPGTHGPACDKNCSVHCAGADHACSHVDGGCYGGCEPGYTGDTCDQNCSHGKFGSNCSESCSNCKDADCNHTDGICSHGCEDGYQGTKCEEMPGKGENTDIFTHNCSVTCGRRNNSCNQTDGTCTQGYDPGYTGRFCLSKCESSTWGENCSKDCSTECVDRSCHHETGVCTCWPRFWNLFCGEATVQLGAVLGGAVLVLIVCVIIGGVCVRRSVQFWVCVYQSLSSPCVSSLAVYVSEGQFSSGSVCISLGPHRVCHHWRCVCQKVSSVLGLCVSVLVLIVCVIIGGVCVRRSVQFCVYQSLYSPCVSSLAVYVSEGQFSSGSVCISPCPHRLCHHWRCMCQKVSSVLGLCVSVLVLTVCVIIGGVCVRRSVQFWVCVYQSLSSPCVSSLAVYVSEGQFSSGSVCISSCPHRLCPHWRCMCQGVSTVLCVSVFVLTVCVIIGGVFVRRSVQFLVCVYQYLSSPCVSSLAVYVSGGQFSSGSVCISPCPHRVCHHWRCMCLGFSTVLCVSVFVLTVCVIIGGVCVRRSVQFWVCVYQSLSSPCVIIGGVCVWGSVQFCVYQSLSSPCVSSLAVYVSEGQFSSGSVCISPCPHRVCHHWRCMCQKVSSVLGLCVSVLVLTVCVIIGGVCVRRSVQFWVCVYQSLSSPSMSSLAVYVSEGQFSSGSVCISPCPHRVCHHWRCMCQKVSSVLGLCVSVLVLTVYVIIGGVCVRRSVQFWVCVYQSLSSPCVSSLAVYVSGGQFSSGSVCISPCPHRVCHHWRCMCQKVSSVLGLCVSVLVLTVYVLIGGVCVRGSVQFCVYQSLYSPSVSSLAVYVSEVLVLTVYVLIGGVCVRRYRRRRKSEPNRQVEDDISLCGTPHSERDYVRQGSSRIIAATPLQTDSSNGQTPHLDPNQNHKDIKRDMEGERGGGIDGERDGDIEGGREEDGQDGVLSDTAVPVEILKSYIRQHATDSHLKDEFSSIPMVTSSPQTAGLSPQNVKKNRYKNIIPCE